VGSLYDYANIRDQVDSVCRVRQGSTVDELIEAVCGLLHIYGVVCKRLSFIPNRIRQCKVHLHANYDWKQWIRKYLLELEVWKGNSSEYVFRLFVIVHKGYVKTMALNKYV